jgi:Tol biopolymer transport system component
LATVADDSSPLAAPSEEAGFASFAQGVRVSHYEILSELGRGGMGVVYRARDLRLGHEVALKCPRLDRRLSRFEIRRILREARTAARLSHPYIVPLLDVFEHEGLPLLVFELVEGKSLRVLLSPGEPLPVLEALRYTEEIVEALGAAHARRVLHRDVTPNNVLIGTDGHARLTDFGIAHLLLTPEELSQASTVDRDTASGARVAGTVGYMSPERAVGNPGDHRSDLFSMGAVLYEMCAGEAPFRSSDGRGILDAVLHREPTSLCRLNYETPEELERIVRKALAKRVDERYQDCSDMLADIRALRRRLESGSYEYEPAAQRPRRAGRRWAIAVTLGVLATVVALGAYEAQRRLWQRLPPWTAHRVTAGPGWESDPALSPDGNTIAYTSNRSGNADVWIVDARGGESLRRTTDPARDHSPAWYPDGAALAFVSDRGGSDSIWKLPRLGGAPTLLVTDAVDPAISPDGTRIAFARRDVGGSLRIGLADLADPARSVVLTGEGDGLWDHRSPAWSPDSRFLCYEDFRDLWLVPAAGGKARRLTTEHETDRHPVWSPDGSHVYFHSMRAGSSALWRVRVRDGRTERLTPGSGPETRPSVSRDGRRMAFATYATDPDLAILDLESGGATRLTGSATEALPAFSPDGGWIVFCSDRAGKYDLWVQDLVAGRPAGASRRLTDHPGSATTPVVSPDGRWIAYGRVVDQERDVWILPAGGGPAVNFSEHPAVEMHPAWSPDGGRLAFVSDRDGAERIWIAEVRDGRRSGEAARLTSGKGEDSFPCWSPDGRRIAFVRSDQGTEEIWIVGVAGGQPARPLTSGAGARCARWEAGGEFLWVNGRWGGDRFEIRRTRARDGETMPLHWALFLPDSLAATTFDLSRDGRFLAHVAEQEPRSDVWLMEVTRRSF